ncbi:MAG: DUF4070 domain-containing protein [Phycisphaerae bacterium]|nr:DUF4070 domain-containing protein [Phycisphaerae bacterium]
MKILLVSPEIPNTFWSLKTALKFTSKKAAQPPLGLLTVAAMLPKEWQLKLVDMSVTSLRDKDILWADYVFLSAMYIQRASVEHVIDRCIKLGAKTVAGGPLFTATPEEFEHVDHLVLNEAEITLAPFLHDLQNGVPKHLYTSTEWAHMQETPIPRWDLVDMKKYFLMGVQYSRGCPFNCDFCNVTSLFGRRMRTKSKDQMIAELDNLYAAGWRGMVFVVDDNFIGNKKRLKDDILPAMIAWMKQKNRPFRFNTQVSINLADDDELLATMAEAGFDCVFVGIETADEDSLTECNKLQNKGRDVVACVKKLQSYGMEVQAGFILGFDSDRDSVFNSLIRLIQESGIVTAMVGLLNAPRGTELYQRLVDQGRLLEYGSGDNTDFSINFTPRMNWDDLLKGYQKVVRTIYSPEQYYQRILTFLKNYVPADHGKVRLSRSDLQAFIKSIWLIGIAHPGRRYYWKLIARSVRSPQHFHLLITFAIYGFHFRSVFGI